MKTLANIGKNIGVICLAILVLIIGSIAGGVLKLALQGYYLKLIIPCLVRIILTMVLAWAVSKYILKIEADELGIKPKKMSIGVILIAVIMPILVLLFYAFVLPCKPYVAREGELVKSIITAIFSVGISAGFTEEVVFRGIIFRYMKKTLGVKIAVIAPAVLFAAVHITNMSEFNITDVVLLLLAGSGVAILFTMMALKLDSLYPGILAHSLWNIFIIGGIFGVGDIVNGNANESYIILPIQSASKLLTGGNFGIEAALPGIVAYFTFSMILLLSLGSKNKNK